MESYRFHVSLKMEPTTYKKNLGEWGIQLGHLSRSKLWKQFVEDSSHSFCILPQDNAFNFWRKIGTNYRGDVQTNAKVGNASSFWDGEIFGCAGLVVIGETRVCDFHHGRPVRAVI